MPEAIPIPDGSVVITPAQQYAELRALTDAVKDLAGKVDPALVEVTKDITDHEYRIRALERRVWQAAGAVALVAGGGAAAVTKLLGG